LVDGGVREVALNKSVVVVGIEDAEAEIFVGGCDGDIRVGVETKSGQPISVNRLNETG
jgi:hypothetical protein